MCVDYLFLINASTTSQRYACASRSAAHFHSMLHSLDFHTRFSFHLSELLQLCVFFGGKNDSLINSIQFNPYLKVTDQKPHIKLSIYLYRKVSGFK